MAAVGGLQDVHGMLLSIIPFSETHELYYIPFSETCQGGFMFSKELFGRRLLEIRKQNSETQTELGEAIGVAKSRVSEMENGKQTTTAEKIALICEHYHISADYLLGLSDNPKRG